MWHFFGIKHGEQWLYESLKLQTCHCLFWVTLFLQAYAMLCIIFRVFELTLYCVCGNVDVAAVMTDSVCVLCVSPSKVLFHMREVICVPFFLVYPFLMASCKAIAYSSMASWNPSTNMLTWNGLCGSQRGSDCTVAAQCTLTMFSKKTTKYNYIYKDNDSISWAPQKKLAMAVYCI